MKYRFLSLEFIFYYIFLLLNYIYGFKQIYDFAELYNKPEFDYLFGSFKGKGYLLGRRNMDLSDIQLRDFRENSPLLLSLSIIYLVISRFLHHFLKNQIPRYTFYLLSGFGVVFFLFGKDIVWIVLIAYINYLIGKIFKGSRLNVFFTWIWCCLSTLLVIYFDGVPIKITSYIPLINWKGLLRWYITFNQVMLKMISFNVDRYGAIRQSKYTNAEGQIITFEEHCKQCLECRKLGPDQGCVKWREHTHPPCENFNLFYYFIFVFYVPLFLAGPFMNFDSFYSFLKYPQKTYPIRRTILYFLRILLLIVLLEVGQHFAWPWVFFSHQEVLTVMLNNYYLLFYHAYIQLFLMFCKWTVIWRFFRLWALIDGVEPLEDMTRCINSHYSIRSFWQHWHRSFYHWLIRYIYIPIGGRTTNIGLTFLNYFLVFSFVTLWHDHTMNLFLWGWVMVIFVFPEIVTSTFLNKPKFHAKWWFRHLASIGASFQICILMIGNLIGYSLGVKNTLLVFNSFFFNFHSLVFLCNIFFCFFAATQINMEYRAWEKESNKID